MKPEAAIPTEDRVLRLLEHLGVRKAHFAARVPGDWQGLVRRHPEAVASLALLCPRPSNLQTLAALGSRLLVMTGDLGREAAIWRQSQEGVPGARLVALPDYLPSSASDIVAEHMEAIGAAMLEFLGCVDPDLPVPPLTPAQAEGQAGGLLYRIQGSGPPLVLCPLQYAPTQWDSLLPRLSQKYCTVTVGGPYLGAIRSLERAGQGGIHGCGAPGGGRGRVAAG